MKVPRSAVRQVVESMLECTGIRKATKYLDANTTVKCTRQRPYDSRDRQETLLLTIGKPNYAERKFIKLCQKAGDPFPVRKVQFQFYK